MTDAEKVFDVLAPMIRSGRSPTIAEIAAKCGMQNKHTSGVLKWMAEEGWILRYRDTHASYSKWEYSLPVEDHRPETMPSVPLNGHVIMAADDYETALYGTKIIEGLRSRERDITESIQAGVVARYPMDRQRWNTEQSEIQGRVRPWDFDKALKFAVHLHEQHRGVVIREFAMMPGTLTLADRIEFDDRRRPVVCDICGDVYFERDAEQRECYACEEGLPLPS